MPAFGAGVSGGGGGGISMVRQFYLIFLFYSLLFCIFFFFANFYNERVGIHNYATQWLMKGVRVESNEQKWCKREGQEANKGSQ